ncbi:hypothetical protein [Ruminococcus sp.]|uniref:hypothetical protein n=1 Tax=Ruminococcus sp. TaxID=41978 RepID=UPI002C81F4F2|nr:hypothetical protein [Ruminococcus sp.]HOA00086.1 hypothetical protein [Ruminococcus sp.]HOH87016.1 hypothetical protein [Ruminococcus sp.]
MRKARFIGILMAAVMAAVPFTGTAKNIGINSIEANARNSVLRDEAGFIYTCCVDEPNVRGITINGWNKWGSKYRSGDDLGNGNYHLSLWYGVLTIRKYINGKDANGVPQNDYAYYNVFRFDTGGGDMICFQLDGNLVVYSGITGKPTAHTGTCSTYQSTNQGYAYEYALTNDGRLLIYRFYPGYYYDRTGALKGKYQIIWDSSKDKMYRI